MKTIAMEEHFLTPKFVGETKKLSDIQADGPFALYASEQKAVMPKVFDRLLDLDEGRLADMDAHGIDVQVLQFAACSHTFDPVMELSLAKDANDVLAEAIRKHPDRYAGLAQLPLQSPDAAVEELDRCINKLGFKGAVWSGRCGDLYLDHPSFYPIMEKLESLDVPIYLHPGLPSKEVFKSWYSKLPEGVAGTLALAGWGWHAETALHSLRLVISGLFDRFPRLQFIIGHMGEGIPFSLARANTWMTPVATHLERTVEEYFLSNFHITTSGYFSYQTLLCAMSVFGADRVIFSVDYPYSTNTEGRVFLDGVPISLVDKEKISHLNAEKLLKL